MPCGHAIARKEWINLSGSSWGAVTSESLHLVRFRGEGVLARRLQQGPATGKHGSQIQLWVMCIRKPGEHLSSCRF